MRSPRSPRSLRLGGELLLLLAVLVLAACLRLVNLADNPGWYADEGTHLDIARRLLRGQTQYLAVNQSILLFARLPLFEALLAGLMGVFGPGIETLRGFTALLGVASVGLLHAVARRAGAGRALALLAAFMLATYPPAVLYSRFGFSYNLLAPLALGALLGLSEYARSARRAWLALAAVAIGLGCVSDLAMAAFLSPFAAAVAVKRWRDLLWSLPLAGLPFALYAAAMLAAAPGAFAFDLRFTLARMGGYGLADQIRLLATNFTILLTQDAWLAVGLVGLFLLRPARLKWLALALLWLPLAALGRTAALHSLSFYYVIPVLPFVALGVASLARHGAPAAAGQVRAAAAGLTGRIPRAGALLAAVVLACAAAPFAASAALTAERARGPFGTVIDVFLLDPGDARRAAAFVNARAGAGDLVLASPGLAWMIEADVADMQMAVAAGGIATPHLPAGLPADRWAFDPRPERARYVIVDNLWRNWAAGNIPAVAALMRRVESWPRAFQSGQIAVFANPGEIYNRSER